MAARKRELNREPKQASSTSKGGRIIEMEEAQHKRRNKRKEVLEASKLKQREDKVKERRHRKQVEKKERRRLSGGKKLLVFLAMVVALAFLGLSCYKIVNLKMEEAKVNDTYDKKVSEKKKLEREYSMVNEPKFIEKQARERFHMIVEGEMLYIYPEDQGDNSQ
ncbi:MAG: septum formation initiator family protein [Clostridiales Family XIII bacterium]|jgi:cell division protein FtsB|nr:septum formation initiator family protein [Clostridiales Family XIII bacterium]